MMDPGQTLGPSGPPRQSGVLVVWQSAQALVSPEAVAVASSAEGEEVLGSVSISIPIPMESSRRDAIADPILQRDDPPPPREDEEEEAWCLSSAGEAEAGRGGAGRARVLGSSRVSGDGRVRIMSMSS
jgi:hypothetical protein